jgi:FKBP-type peptidyl-prolyl cis-trans isomerase
MKISNVLIGLLVLLVACSNPTKKTAGGMEFKVLKTGDGTLPQSGQLVVFNYKMIDSNDSVWIDTYDRGLPEVTSIGDSIRLAEEDGFQQMLRMMSEGDSTTFEMPVKTFFKEFVKADIPPLVDSTMDIKYYVSVSEIMSQEEFPDFRTKEIEKYEARLELKKAEQLAKDTVVIDKFLTDNGIKTEKTSSGLRYVIIQSGNGSNAVSGQTAKINYSGYLLDGTFFDSSKKNVAEEKGVYSPMREPYEPIEVTIDSTSVIQGWHEALKLMSEGTQATFYIPSSLAYGAQQRSEIIKPNSILVFDLEMIELN